MVHPSHPLEAALQAAGSNGKNYARNDESQRGQHHLENILRCLALDDTTRVLVVDVPASVPHFEESGRLYEAFGSSLTGT